MPRKRRSTTGDDDFHAADHREPSVKFNPLSEEVAKLLILLREGNYVETACRATGIAHSSLYQWLKAASKEREGPLRDFADKFYEALSQAESEQVLRIGLAARNDWRAAAFLLERKFPDRWGRREQLVIRQQIQVEMALAFVEELKPILVRRIPDPSTRNAILGDLSALGTAPSISEGSRESDD